MRRRRRESGTGPEFLVDRSADSHREHSATDGATCAYAGRGHLRGINTKDRLTLRTGNVHFASVADATRRVSKPARSGVGASVRRSIAYTDPGSVFA